MKVTIEINDDWVEDREIRVLAKPDKGHEYKGIAKLGDILKIKETGLMVYELNQEAFQLGGEVFCGALRNSGMLPRSTTDARP